MVRFVHGKWTDFVGGRVTQSLLSPLPQEKFVNEMGLKKQTKLIAGAVQPETKPTVASEARKRAGKSQQQNVASSVFGQKATDKQNCS